MRLLVRLPNWVGDVVMATPALRALRRGLPDAQIVWAHRPYVARLLDGLPWHDGRLPEAGPSWLAFRTLRRERFDAALLLPSSFGSAWSALAAGIPRRVGLDAQGRGFLLTDAVARPALEYTGRTLARLAEALGCLVDDPRPELVVTAEEEAKAGALWKELGLEGRRVVGIAPGAAFGSSKCWPPGHFAGVARTLWRKSGTPCLLVYGPGEEETAGAIRAAAGEAVVSAGPDRVDLGVLKAVTRRLSALLANDSGPRHVAEALGVPVVTLQGPVDPRYSDSGNPRVRALREDVECSPCGLKTCPLDHRCLTRIGPERALSALHELLP